MSVAHPRLASPSWLRLPRRTARLRLTALYGGLFLLTGAALAAITYVLFERATEYRTPPLPKIPPTPALGKLQLPSPLAGSLPQQYGLLQNQLAQAQNQLAQVRNQLAGLPAGPLAARDQQLRQDQQQLTQDQHQLTQAVRQLAQAVHQLAQAGTVQAAQRAADSHQLLVNSGIALAIVAVLALLAGWLVAGRMLRPIRTITRTARRISSTSLHERLALDGPPDELKELGDTLDSLFARLEAAFEAQRHFVANASHELRTPLTAERALLQVALDDPDTTAAAWRSTAQEVLASSDEQARLIEALLTLASSEGGLTDHQPVDLATAVAAPLADLRPETGRLGINIGAVTEPAALDGDPLLVERLVANLLTNAVRHNVADGRVEVRTGTTDGRAVLSVTNTGPLIPLADIDRLFQPFQRLDRRRANYTDGHGLGLSIVRAIATAHDATIAAHPRPDGGLSVSVIFPQPASPTAAPDHHPQSDRRSLETAKPLPGRSAPGEVLREGLPGEAHVLPGLLGGHRGVPGPDRGDDRHMLAQRLRQPAFSGLGDTGVAGVVTGERAAGPRDRCGDGDGVRVLQPGPGVERHY
jgi:signal transduction histidine kinase